MWQITCTILIYTHAIHLHIHFSTCFQLCVFLRTKPMSGRIYPTSLTLCECQPCRWLMKWVSFVDPRNHVPSTTHLYIRRISLGVRCFSCGLAGHMLDYIGPTSCCPRKAIEMILKFVWTWRRSLGITLIFICELAPLIRHDNIRWFFDFIN